VWLLAVDTVTVQGRVDFLDVFLWIVGPVWVFLHVEHEICVEFVVADGVDNGPVGPRSLRRLAEDEWADLLIGFQSLVYRIDACAERIQLCLAEVYGFLE